MTKKPKTKITPLYRVQLNCKIGRDYLECKIVPPDGIPRIDYALFCMFHAIEDLAKMIEEKK